MVVKGLKGVLRGLYKLLTFVMMKWRYWIQNLFRASESNIFSEGQNHTFRIFRP